MERDAERERERLRTWEEVGADVAPALDAASAVVVVGDDPVAAAEVALGAGRAQGARRRVAIGDLVGDVAPLQALVTGDDPHGLVDSFLYGVSLNRIARPAPGFRNLYILPSGTEPVVAEEIFRNERWRRLAIGFSEVGALLLLVARADAPGVEALIAQLDGALVVGATTRVADGVKVLAAVGSIAEPHEIQETTDEYAIPTAVVSEYAAQQPAREPAAGGEPVVHAAAPETPAAPAADVAVPIAVAAEAPRGDSESATEVENREVLTPRDVPVDVDASEALRSADATPAASADDEPRDARWVRRVATAPPTQVHISAQPDADPREKATAPRAVEQPWRPSRARWLLPIAAVVLVAVIGLGALLTRGDNAGTRTEAGRRAAGGQPAADSAPVAAATPADSVAATSAAAGGEVAGAAGGASAAATPAYTTPPGEPALPALAVANPADSARAATYAIQIVAANTLAGAKAKQRDVAWGLPAAVVSPMALSSDNTRWFRLTVGAFSTRNEAAAYAVDLRKRRKLDLDPASVVTVPYALLLEENVPRARAAARVATFAARGLPAYALLQPDGTARVYAGAFETPQQAALMASAATAADVTPVVVYRTGRSL
jgi:hypothetical protein